MWGFRGKTCVLVTRALGFVRVKGLELPSKQGR